MKTKTSVTLDGGLLSEVDKYGGDYKSRSEFIQAAVGFFIRHLAREEADRRDLDILNRHAETLNAEAEDVLAYQVPV
jgi:metal-responsive CopG/Arc/MetJ family transcriptional regulator